MADVELLNKALESFNAASTTLMQYYRSLEDKVTLLTEEVEHKKRLLDSILDSVDVGVVFFDKDGRVQLVNAAAEELLGVGAGEIVGGDSIRAVIEGEVITPERGKPFYALVSRSEVRDRAGKDMRDMGYVLLFKDITRLKQLEVENERNRRLTAMGELVLKIAHEIRNPLGSIELFASLLSADLRGSAQGDYAQRISNSVRSLVNTLDNMLRFSRGITPAAEPCRLDEIVDELCAEFGELFSAAKVRVARTGRERHSIIADRSLLRQALMNLLLNAVQAMPDGGTITVDIDASGSGISEPDVAGGAGETVLRISDTGAGMDDETRARIFEPFFSTKDRGTGLGMSITAGIIAAHKGAIAVTSEPGRGTEFVITLPPGPGRRETATEENG